jgi:hypothetical protein
MKVMIVIVGTVVIAVVLAYGVYSLTKQLTIKTRRTKKGAPKV